MIVMSNPTEHSSQYSEWQIKRDAQREQVVQWAKQLLNGGTSRLHQEILKRFLKESPSGLDQLNLKDYERLQKILNEDES
jgi:hypothetical protein